MTPSAAGPPADCIAVCAAQPPGHPPVLSTDMHITRGLLDMDRVRWDPKRLTLSREAVRAPGEEGAVYVHVPEGYEVREGEAVEVVGDERVRMAVRFREAREGWEVRFGKP